MSQTLNQVTMLQYQPLMELQPNSQSLNDAMLYDDQILLNQHTHYDHFGESGGYFQCPSNIPCQYAEQYCDTLCQQPFADGRIMELHFSQSNAPTNISEAFRKLEHVVTSLQMQLEAIQADFIKFHDS